MEIAEVAYTVFIDIVGYSKSSTSKQVEMISTLNREVNAIDIYQKAIAAKQVLPLPTGDGMALIFFHDVNAPALCATALSESINEHELPLRIGVHGGLIKRQHDVAGHENVAGEGINTAQRIMDFGDAGHILLSEPYAKLLLQLDEWKPFVRPVGSGTAKHNVRLPVYSLVSERFGNTAQPSKVQPEPHPADCQQLVIVYRRNTKPDDEILELLEFRLQGLGHKVFIDRHLRIGIDWAKAIEEKIRSADAVIAIVSDASSTSEMVEYELELAYDEFKRRGRPFVLPIRVASERRLEGSVAVILRSINYITWNSPADNNAVVTAILSALAEPQITHKEEQHSETIGGAMSSSAGYYIERATDEEFLQSLRRRESIVLVKGPRQIGKTSLIGKGTELVIDLQWRAIVTDCQQFSSQSLETEEAFYQLLCAIISNQLSLHDDWRANWQPMIGPNMNLDLFIRNAIKASPAPLVWFIDEADRLFGLPFARDFFGLVRSWHNSRAIDPRGNWSQLCIVVGYATEAHLFIEDLNQSPFNVGRKIELLPFSLEQTSELNKRYNGAVKSLEDLQAIYDLVGGQPFLTRRAFDVLSRGSCSVEELFLRASRDDGPFGDHLKRVLISVSQMPEVLAALKASLDRPQIAESKGLYRLVAAGILEQKEDGSFELRNQLYSKYLIAHLRD